MKLCPKCNLDFIDEAVICYHCQVPLVDEAEIMLKSMQNENDNKSKENSKKPRSMFEAFEKIKHIKENNCEYWYAREFMKILEYTKWKDCLNLISKSEDDCVSNDKELTKYFLHIKRSITINNITKDIDDIILSRYACRLIIQNEDQQKDIVIFALKYFKESPANEDAKNQNFANENATNESSTKEWYYALNGKRIGPISKFQLLKLYKSDVIFSSTKVWKLGFSDWIVLSETDLIEKSNTPPPLKGNEIDDNLIWSLIMMEPIKLILYFLFWKPFGILGSFLVLLIFWFIERYLIKLDLKKLRDAGYTDKSLNTTFDTKYLFNRAKLLNQNNIYAIVYCIIWCVILLIFFCSIILSIAK